MDREEFYKRLIKEIMDERRELLWALHINEPPEGGFNDKGGAMEEKEIRGTVKKIQEKIEENKDVFDKLTAGEVPTDAELDDLHKSINPDRDHTKRRALQNKYEFLKAKSIQEDLMAFGFECSDGWLPILEELFAKIDEVVKRDKVEGFKVVQVKEKFGMLRVYAHNGNDEIQNLLRKVEKIAGMTCEDCGQPGENREVNGWWRTQCDTCYGKRLMRHGLIDA
jgi:ribosomal protein L37AE/L43A